MSGKKRTIFEAVAP